MLTTEKKSSCIYVDNWRRSHFYWVRPFYFLLKEMSFLPNMLNSLLRAQRFNSGQSTHWDTKDTQHYINPFLFSSLLNKPYYSLSLKKHRGLLTSYGIFWIVIHPWEYWPLCGTNVIDVKEQNMTFMHRWLSNKSDCFLIASWMACLIYLLVYIYSSELVWEVGTTSLIDEWKFTFETRESL